MFVGVCFLPLPLRAEPDAPVGSANGSIAVVVSNKSPIFDLTLPMLRLAYLGEIVFIEELLTQDHPTHEAIDERVVLLDYVPAESRFLDLVLHRSFLQYRRYWTKRVLSGESGDPPIRCRDQEEFGRRLHDDPSAIGFLPADAIPDSLLELLRIVPIDGRSPQSPDYPLK